MSDIQINCDKDYFTPGEIIRGEVFWNCSKEPSNILINLEWRTEGRGTSDSGAVFDDTLSCSQKEGHRNFEIKIPDNCPPSYSGVLVSVLWSIKVSADISWKKDPKAYYPIIISKNGRVYTPLNVQSAE